MTVPQVPEDPKIEEDRFQSPLNLTDTWIAVISLVVWAAASLGLSLLMHELEIENDLILLVVEVSILLPVMIQMARKEINWAGIGFRPFKPQDMGLGCGLLVAAYIVIIIHNLLMFWLGIPLQMEYIQELFDRTKSLWVIIATAVVLAPFVEEIFFRGFLYTSLRKKFSWVYAGLISAGIFAFSHMMPVVLVPTFLLGFIFAYLYERTRSLWPGILLHLLVNSVGMTLAYFLTSA